MAINRPGNIGSFLPTTIAFDEETIRNLDLKSDEFREFLIAVLNAYNKTALVVNTKESAYYYLDQFVTSGMYFPTTTNLSTTQGRPVARAVVNFGALPNAGTKSVAHNIPSFPDPTSAVRIYAAATQPSTSWIPIPFASPTLNKNIQLDVDSVNVNITTGIDYTAYTECYVVIEYILS